MKHLFFLTFYLLISMHSKAQSTINAAGKSATTGTIQHDYSIAEMTIVGASMANPNLIVTQGVLQPSNYKASNQNLVNTAVSCYPNPTTDIVYVQFNSTQNIQANILIMDANGKILQNIQQQFQTGKHSTPISFEQYANGNYIIKTQFNTGQFSETQSFKILKK